MLLTRVLTRLTLQGPESWRASRGTEHHDDTVNVAT